MTFWDKRLHVSLTISESEVNEIGIFFLFVRYDTMNRFSAFLAVMWLNGCTGNLVDLSFENHGNLRGSSSRRLALPSFLWPFSGKDRSYISVTDPAVLGEVNYDVTLENPMKGLLTSPWWTDDGETEGVVPSMLEFFYIPMDDVMKGWQSFDWSTLDASLDRAERLKKHVIWRVSAKFSCASRRI